MNVDIRGLAALTLADLAPDAGLARSGDPLVIIDLDAGPEPADADLAAAARAAQAPGRVTVGVLTTPTPERLAAAKSLTCTLGPPEAANAPALVPAAHPWQAAARLAERMAKAPLAAGVLDDVLRFGANLEVGAALLAESLAYSALLAGPEHRSWLAGPRPAARQPAGPTVLVERAGGGLSITLNRPERRNAFDRSMRAELVAALAVAVADPGIERIDLAGAGPLFCSGGDLGEFGTAPDPVTAHLVRTTASPASLMHACADRLRVRVHGSCAGAGVELPAFAARVIAAPGTTFRLPELDLGLIPGAGGTVGLPRRIGRWRTAWLALSGDPLPAPTALAWGLIDSITPSDPAD